MAQQAQLIGHGGLALADALGGLLLAEAVEAHEAGEALGLFNEVEVPALEVLHQGQHP